MNNRLAFAGRTAMKVFMGPVICVSFAGARFASMNGPEKGFSILKKFLPTFIPFAWKGWEGMESGFIGATGIIPGFTRFNICAKFVPAQIVFRVVKRT
jgi:hypothetical protein